MIAGYSDLTPETLVPYGFDDPAHACRLLQDMAGHNVPDSIFDATLRVLLAALVDCADPDRVVANLARWVESVGSRVAAYGLLAAHPPATQILVTVLAASQFFADLLIQTPEYLEALTNSRLRQAPRSLDIMAADMARRVLLPSHPNARRDALRRAKGPEVLRIGVRDLLGEATFAQTVADISAFADCAVRLAWQICTEERGVSRFAVLAMGKMGGQELNYSSDIDLIFVHADDEDAGSAIKLGEAIRDTLAKVTSAGFVFRVDLRLRPEGRFGPLSRSVSSCRAYYESWAEPWERQALMKARFVAGNADIGAAFLQMTQDFVYPPRVDEAFVDSIRQNKRRLEQKIAHAGESDVNVKEGIGGIRDVEFAVQLMQLVAGGANPALRSGNTLTALSRLTQAGLLTDAEHETLHESYIFLRTVEHRLQLLDEQAVRDIPRAPGPLHKFARRLGYPEADTFLHDFRRHTQRTHALFTRLFYGLPEASLSVPTNAPDKIADWALAPDDPAAQNALRDALAAHGIADTNTGLRLIRRAVQGSEYGGVRPEARDAFVGMLGPLLDAVQSTADPDAALRGMDALADAAPSRASLFVTLRDSPRLLPRLCRLAGNAPALWQILLGHLEFLDMLADEEVMDTPRVLTIASTLPQIAIDTLRARLHIGARDVWGLASTAETLAQTTRVAEVALQSALGRAIQDTQYPGRFCVIGLGKLGGAEMAYASDMDVLYVADSDHLTAATRLAEHLQHLLHDDLARSGVRFEIDARLRPEGRKGALVLDLGTYRAYYSQGATWERQTLIKARPVAGEDALGQEFIALTEDIVYAGSADEATVDTVRSMKHRIETERAKSPLDLKLGPGGLSDIEWTAQLLQMQYGAKRRRVRVPGTLPALLALRDDALLTQADWEILSQTYLELAQWRNRRFLHSGVAGDDADSVPEDLRRHMQHVRTVFRRVFSGERDIPG